MLYDPPLTRARFLARRNRFVAEILVNGTPTPAHLPNPGRMHELLIPGVECYGRYVPSPTRKLDWELSAVRKGRVLVNLQSYLANDLADEALRARKIPSLADYDTAAREVRQGASRVDFLLRHRTTNREMTMEVKACNLVIGRHGFFPDAPTIRGAKHVREATERVRGGDDAAILFCVQRPDCDVVSPNDETDPDFATALREAADTGVGIFAARCTSGVKRIAVTDEIRVEL
ncbi:MAG: DNA/RNA nuclease SfsA [Deltaproteobacteria bacterium]|nr:DNA/RNA nuclease SfsA [Deltaproteobacteria bacterium]